MYRHALIKVLQVEMDEYFLTYPTDTRLEEQLEIMQKSLKELNLKIRMYGAQNPQWPDTLKITVDKT